MYNPVHHSNCSLLFYSLNRTNSVYNNLKCFRAHAFIQLRVSTCVQFHTGLQTKHTQIPTDSLPLLSSRASTPGAMTRNHEFVFTSEDVQDGGCTEPGAVAAERHQETLSRHGGAATSGGSRWTVMAACWADCPGAQNERGGEQTTEEGHGARDRGRAQARACICAHRYSRTTHSRR